MKLYFLFTSIICEKVKQLYLLYRQQSNSSNSCLFKKRKEMKPCSKGFVKTGISHGKMPLCSVYQKVVENPTATFPQNLGILGPKDYFRRKFLFIFFNMIEHIFTKTEVFQLGPIKLMYKNECVSVGYSMLPSGDFTFTLLYIPYVDPNLLKCHYFILINIV